MFCSNCGTKIEDTANFCYKCGSRITQNAQANNTASNNYQQQNNAYQQSTSNASSAPIKCGVNVVFPDGHSEIGDLYISSTELLFVKKSKGVAVAFGQIGRSLEKGEERLCFNVSDIIGGQKTRIGINFNVYQITLRNGEIYKLCMDKPKMVSYLQGMFG